MSQQDDFASQLRALLPDLHAAGVSLWTQATISGAAAEIERLQSVVSAAEASRQTDDADDEIPPAILAMIDAHTARILASFVEIAERADRGQMTNEDQYSVGAFLPSFLKEHAAALAEITRLKNQDTSATATAPVYDDTGSAQVLPGGGLGCFDCGTPYGGARFPDLIIPNEAWRAISPTGGEGGLLCPNCIAGRLEIQGLTNVPGRFTSGAMAADRSTADAPTNKIARGLKEAVAYAKGEGPARVTQMPDTSAPATKDAPEPWAGKVRRLWNTTPARRLTSRA